MPDFAGLPGPAGPAGPVDVLVTVGRDAQLDHQRDVGVVDAAGRNVRCLQPGTTSDCKAPVSHSTVTAQSQHSHSTATAQSRDANRAQHRIVKHQSAPDVHGHPKLEHIAQRVYSGRCRVETCLRNGPNQLSNESIMPKSRIPQSPPSWRPGTQPRSLCGMPATYGNGA